MNSLEEYLRKEGILEKFLGNVVFSRFVNSADLDTAFFWQDTEEGRGFWYEHYINSGCTDIAKSKIKELIQEAVPRFRKEQKC